MIATGMALQLYTVREPAARDLPGTLQRIRAMGWRYVQWSGMPDLSAQDIRAQLDAAGLVCIAGHSAVEPFEKDFERTVAFWKDVGAPDVAPGGMMSDCRASLEAWLRGAARLDALGAGLRGAGMRLSYHNHAFEFETFPEDDRPKLDILYGATSPEHVYAELDTAWVHVGGADPAAYIRKYAGRCPVIHVKDVEPRQGDAGGVEFAPLGEGALDWPSIFAAGRASGVEWYVYEQDSGRGDVWDDVEKSYRFLAEHG